MAALPLSKVLHCSGQWPHALWDPQWSAPDAPSSQAVPPAAAQPLPAVEPRTSSAAGSRGRGKDGNSPVGSCTAYLAAEGWTESAVIAAAAAAPEGSLENRAPAVVARSGSAAPMRCEAALSADGTAYAAAAAGAAAGTSPTAGAAAVVPLPLAAAAAAVPPLPPPPPVAVVGHAAAVAHQEAARPDGVLE